MPIWRRLQDSLPRLLPPIVCQVFVINSGAYVTKVTGNFYELLLLIQRTMQCVSVCFFTLTHGSSQEERQTNRGIESG
jgi:hypothetical protein